MTLLVRWRAPGAHYCVIVIGCNFCTTKCIYLIFIHCGQNIPTFNNINDFNIYTCIVTLSFLSHLLIARCDIGVQLSVRSFVRPSVRPQFMSRSLLCSSDSWEYETLHSNYP